jgi:hypothetical protein
MQCVLCMFMIYRHKKFHMSGTNCSLVIAIKPEEKYRFLVLPCFFFPLNKISALTKVLFFPKIYVHTKLQDFTLEMSLVVHKLTWPWCSYLLVAGNLKYKGEINSNNIMFIPSLRKIFQFVTKPLGKDRHTDKWTDTGYDDITSISSLTH